MRNFDGRFISRAIGAAGVLGMLAFSPGQALAQSQTLEATSYPGIWEKVVNDFFVTEWKKIHPGIEARVTAGNPDPWISQIQANPSQPP